jgi:tRNA pseudouridine38-40 synthase
MVRTVVGTLVEIARGKIPAGELPGIIEGKDRRLAGPAAPAHGLYLSKIEYPRDIFVKL